jgi:hypothetical protein
MEQFKSMNLEMIHVPQQTKLSSSIKINCYFD